MSTTPLNTTTDSADSQQGVRRRVFILGIISVLVGLGQTLAFLIILGLVLSPEHMDVEVAVGSGSMAILTATYVGLTGRLLFLVYERRYFETEGPEWIWWFCSLTVVLFNVGLLIWFILLHDYLPGVMCAVAIPAYTLFFMFAKDDIKGMKDRRGRVQT